MTEKDKEKEELCEELDRQFPKGDKARGRALLLFGIACININQAREQGRKEVIDDEIGFLIFNLDVWKVVREQAKQSKIIDIFARADTMVDMVEKKIKELIKSKLEKKEEDTEEFNLSEHLVMISDRPFYFVRQDKVKEFIKICEEIITRRCKGTSANCYEIKKEIRERAGDKLK